MNQLVSWDTTHVTISVQHHSRMNRLQSNFFPFVRFFGWLGYGYSLNYGQSSFRWWLRLILSTIGLACVLNARIPHLTNLFGPWNDFFKFFAYSLVYIVAFIESWNGSGRLQDIWDRIENIHNHMCRLTQEMLLRMIFKNFRRTYFLLMVSVVLLGIFSMLVHVTVIANVIEDNYYKCMYNIELAFVKFFIEIRHFQLILYVNLQTIFLEEIGNQIDICANENFLGRLHRLHSVTKIYIKLSFLNDDIHLSYEMSLVMFVSVWHFEMLANSYWFVDSITLYGTAMYVSQIFALLLNSASLILMHIFCEELRNVYQLVRAKINNLRLHPVVCAGYSYQLIMCCTNQFMIRRIGMFAMGCFEVSYYPIVSIIVSACTYLAFFIEIESRLSKYRSTSYN
ncbi:AAEL017295-PA, partial [Aedes aegypti]